LRGRQEFAALAEAKGLEADRRGLTTSCERTRRCSDQIIQNLVAKAIRYTRNGWVRLQCSASLHAVQIQVADTGIGIPADELELVFDAYYQSSRKIGESRQGVGLGLSIARRVASLLGCSLDVTSTVGRGSCFTVGVPRSAARTTIASERPKTPTATVPEGALVLVIDDERAVADATALLLGTEGLDVLVADGSRQDLDVIRAHGRPPDLLICDYHLGKGNRHRGHPSSANQHGVLCRRYS
jgi:two-component system CheB/CheR fusion protein